jgi:hypothetical protein
LKTSICYPKESDRCLAPWPLPWPWLFPLPPPWPSLVCPLVVVSTPPPLILSTHLHLLTRNLGLSTPRRLLSSGASLPACLLFAGCLLCLLLSCYLHLTSPFIVRPPHKSILDPPSLFTPAGCRVTSLCTASASQRTPMNGCSGCPAIVQLHNVQYAPLDRRISSLRPMCKLRGSESSGVYIRVQ